VFLCFASFCNGDLSDTLQNLISAKEPSNNKEFIIAQYTLRQDQVIPANWARVTDLILNQIVNTNHNYIKLTEDDTKIRILQSGWYEITAGSGSNGANGCRNAAIATFITQNNISKNYGSNPTPDCSIAQNIITEYLEAETVLSFEWRALTSLRLNQQGNTPETLRITVRKLN